jgi:hypothetical protein
LEETDQELPGIDVPGGILPNKSIAIRFTITRQSGGTVYQEVHQHTTDDYGLINVVIGNGNTTGSSPSNFIDIDWDGSPMVLKVEIDLLEDGSSFQNFSEQELFFVPYAFHRNITATGTLDVNQATTLGDDLNVTGITTLDSDLIVANGSPTNLSGDLTVEGEVAFDGDLSLGGNLDVAGVTNLGGVLSVNNNSPSFLSGELMVDGITTLGNALNVTNASPTYLSGSLTTDGASILNGVLTVNEVSTFNESVIFNSDLTISHDNPEYVAIFENLNSGNGDGIKIRLGKRATKNNTLAQTIEGDILSDLTGNISASDINALRRFLDSDPGNDPDIASLLIPIPTAQEVIDLGLATVATACQLTASVTNIVTGFINDAFLPIEIDAVVVDLPLGIGEIEVFPSLTLVPEIPAIPGSLCAVFGPALNLGRLQMSDVYTSNPLDNENHFVTFVDNTDWQMGAIKSQSIEDWATGYLNPVYFHKLYAAFAGLDRSKVFAQMKAEAKELASAYLEIGVEYSSGNGDYAEWLERINPNEHISAGDIVGVKGGKISKNLDGAEQIMAISLRPIVLGNVPPKGQEHLGNMVAFMGQIPVKIVGPVNSGDFIIAAGDIAGYGFAVEPKNMTKEFYKLIIGRSWENNLLQGPKMVNTVIGVQNGDLIDVLSEYDEKLLELNSRLNSIEAMLEKLPATNQYKRANSNEFN